MFKTHACVTYLLKKNIKTVGGQGVFFFLFGFLGSCHLFVNDGLFLAIYLFISVAVSMLCKDSSCLFMNPKVSFSICD